MYELKLNNSDDYWQAICEQEAIIYVPSTYNPEYFCKEGKKKKIKYDSERKITFTQKHDRYEADYLYYPHLHMASSLFEDTMFSLLRQEIGNDGLDEMVIVFSVSPKKINNLSLCLDFIDMVYFRLEGYGELCLDRKEYGHYLKRTITHLPYPVCYYEGIKGDSLKYTNPGDSICWTNYWHIPPENLPLCLKKLYEVACPEKWNAYKDPSKNDEHYDIAGCRKHLRSDKAQEGFKQYSDKLFILDTWKDWPIAFAVKIGRNAIVVVPDCIDVPAFITELESCRPALGIEIIKSYLARRSMPTSDIPAKASIENKIHHIEIISLDTVSKIDEDTTSKLSIKIDGRPIYVAPKHFLKFLVLWYASNVGNGLIYASQEQEEEMKSPLKRIMMLDKKNKPVHLPGAGILYSKDSGEKQMRWLKQELRRIVSFNIYGTQAPGANDNLEMINEIIQPTGPTGEKYFHSPNQDIKFSCLKLNVKVSMPKAARDKLEKLPIDLPNKTEIVASFFKTIFETMP